MQESVRLALATKKGSLDLNGARLPSDPYMTNTGTTEAEAPLPGCDCTLAVEAAVVVVVTRPKGHQRITPPYLVHHPNLPLRSNPHRPRLRRRRKSQSLLIRLHSALL